MIYIIISYLIGVLISFCVAIGIIKFFEISEDDLWSTPLWPLSIIFWPVAAIAIIPISIIVSVLLALHYFAFYEKK